MVKAKKSHYGVLLILLLVVVAAGFLLFYRSESTPKCGIESCHGLDIICGPNVPEVCTEIYMLGDRCRQYVSCGIIDGKCQLIKNEKFEECKSCVEKCLEDFKDDNIELFRCESKCESL